MAITRTPIIDDDGSGSTGTVLDNAWKQELYNQIDASLITDTGTTIATIATAGNYDVATTPSQIRIVRAFPDTADVTIYSASPGRAGDLLVIQHIGTDDSKFVYLPHDTASRPYPGFWNRTTSAWTVLGKFGSAIYHWDLGHARWVLASHDQGTPREIPYSGGMYQPNTGTWVTVFGKTQILYRVVGDSVELTINVNESTITGSPTQLFISGLPFTFRVLTAGSYIQGLSAGPTGGWVNVLGLPSASSIMFTRGDSTPFVNGTNWLACQFRIRLT